VEGDAALGRLGGRLSLVRLGLDEIGRRLRQLPRFLVEGAVDRNRRASSNRGDDTIGRRGGPRRRHGNEQRRPKGGTPIPQYAVDRGIQCPGGTEQRGPVRLSSQPSL